MKGDKRLLVKACIVYILEAIALVETYILYGQEATLNFSNFAVLPINITICVLFIIRWKWTSRKSYDIKKLTVWMN